MMLFFRYYIDTSSYNIYNPYGYNFDNYFLNITWRIYSGPVKEEYFLKKGQEIDGREKQDSRRKERDH